MAPGDGPDETSPLLQTSIRHHTPQPTSNPTITEDDDDDSPTPFPDLEQSHSTASDTQQSQALSDERTSQNQMRYLILPAVGVGVFLAAADSTIIVSSYAAIGNDLEALNLTSWIATAYFLSVTSFQPLFGKLSDIFGRKPCLLFSYVVFGLGSLACGLSTNIYALIAARVVQGIGGGGMTTVVSVLFNDIVPLKDRGLWQGFLNIIYATGSASGASLGGLLADSIGWRWAFLGQPPICLVAIMAVSFVLKLPEQKEEPEVWKVKLKRIDFIGAAMLVAATFALLFGMDRGSNVSWGLPISYAPLAASFVLFTAFILVEMKVAKEPFAPGHVIFGKGMFPGYLCYFFGFGSWLPVMYYLPLFYQASDGISASGAAIRLLPAICASVSGSLFGGFMLKKIGKYYWLTVIAYAAATSGTLIILLFSGTITNNVWGISIGLFTGGFGGGIGMTTVLIALIANSAPEDRAITTACTYLFRGLASAIGVSATSAVIQQVLRSELSQVLGSGQQAADIERGVRRSLEFLKTLDPETQAVVRVAYGHAVRYGYVLVMITSLGTFISSFFLREKKLGK